ncbi:uncharacterized protein [Antedon mediterranea]|uniref:uncharacterized protein isoform X2 n=1 Tax=Antedon mediterranea TaxID=105859 RepID=UPI003AF7CCDD
MEMDENEENRGHSLEDVDPLYLDSIPKSPLLTSDLSIEILELFDSMASDRNGFYSGKSSSNIGVVNEPLNGLLSTQECETNKAGTWQQNTNTELEKKGIHNTLMKPEISDDNLDICTDVLASHTDILSNAMQDLKLDDSVKSGSQTSLEHDKDGIDGLLNGHHLQTSRSSMERNTCNSSNNDLNVSYGSSELTEVNGSNSDYSPDEMTDMVLQIVEEPVLKTESASTEEAFFKRNVATSGSQDSVNNNSNNMCNSNHDVVSMRSSSDFDSTRDSTDFDTTRNSTDYDTTRNSTDFDATDDDDDVDGACSSRNRNSTFIEYKVQEILETERSYVKDLDDIVEGYLLAILDRPTLPLIPEDYQSLFSNLESIRDFNKEFLKDLEDCESDPVLIAECFLEKEEEFIMYSQYCMNYPSAVRVLTKCLLDPTMYSFLQEAQDKLGHPLPLGAYLLKPVQRILKYHLLFHDICKHISRDDDIYDTLEEALDAMKEVAKQINHMKAQSDMVLRVQQIQTLLLDHTRDLSSYGELLLEDVMRLQGSRGARGERHVYLFEKVFFIAKRREDGYIAIKTEIKCSNLLLMENIAKESFGFIVMPFDNRDEQYVLVAKALEQKQQWTHQIKKMILENFSGLIPNKAKDIVLNSQGSKDGDYHSTDEQPVKLRKRKHRSKQRRRRRYSDPASQLRRGNIQVKGMKKPDVAKLMTGKRASSLVRQEGICSTEESMSESESSNSPNRLSAGQVNDKDETTDIAQPEENLILPKDDNTDANKQNDQQPAEIEPTEETIAPETKTDTIEQPSKEDAGEESPETKTDTIEQPSKEDAGEESPDELDILETLHDTIENVIQEEEEEDVTIKDKSSPFKLRSNIKDFKRKKPEDIILDSRDVWIKRPLIRGGRISGIKKLHRPLSADTFLNNPAISKQPLSRSVSSGLQTLENVSNRRLEQSFLSNKINSEPALNKAVKGTNSESSLDQSFSSHESILDSFQDIVAEQENEIAKEKESWQNSHGDIVVKKKEETSRVKNTEVSIQTNKPISAVSVRASKVFKMARDYSQRVKRTSRPSLSNILILDTLPSQPKTENELKDLLPMMRFEEETMQPFVEIRDNETNVEKRGDTERKGRELERRFAIRKAKSADAVTRLSLPNNSDILADDDEPLGNFKRGPSIKDRLRSIKENTAYQKRNEIKDLPPKFKSLKERQKELEKCVTKPIPKTNTEVERLVPVEIEEESSFDETDCKRTKLTRHNSCSSVTSIKLSSPLESKHRRWSSRSSGLDDEDGVLFRSVKQRQQLLQRAYSKPVPKTVDVQAEISKKKWRENVSR